MKKYLTWCLPLILSPLSLDAMENKDQKITNAEQLYFPLFEERTFATYSSKGSSFTLSSIPNRQLQFTIKRIKLEIRECIRMELDSKDTKWSRLLRESAHHIECSKLLEAILQRNVNPDAYDIVFDSPIHNACWSGVLVNAEILLKYNANPNIRDNFGKTPLMIASSGGYLKIVKLLSQHKDIIIDAKDKCGNTALMKVVSKNPIDDINNNDRKEMIIILLNASADPSITNEKDKTAIDIARKNGFNDLAELMENYESMLKLNTTIKEM